MWWGVLTAGVVTRDDGLVLSYAVDVGLHDSAEESGIEVAGVVGVSVAARRDARVDAGGIAVPEVHIDGWDWLASAGVDELDVKIERHAFLAISDVAADQLAVDVVGTLGDFGLQDAGRVVGEEGRFVVAVDDARGRLVGEVVGGEVAAYKRAVDAPLDASLLAHLLTTGKGGLDIASTSKVGLA